MEKKILLYSKTNNNFSWNLFLFLLCFFFGVGQFLFLNQHYSVNYNHKIIFIKVGIGLLSLFFFILGIFVSWKYLSVSSVAFFLTGNKRKKFMHKRMLWFVLTEIVIFLLFIFGLLFFILIKFFFSQYSTSSDVFYWGGAWNNVLCYIGISISIVAFFSFLILLANGITVSREMKQDDANNENLPYFYPSNSSITFNDNMNFIQNATKLFSALRKSDALVLGDLKKAYIEEQDFLKVSSEKSLQKLIIRNFTFFLTLLFFIIAVVTVIVPSFLYSKHNFDLYPYFICFSAYLLSSIATSISFYFSFRIFFLHKKSRYLESCQKIIFIQKTLEQYKVCRYGEMTIWSENSVEKLIAYANNSAFRKNKDFNGVYSPPETSIKQIDWSQNDSLNFDWKKFLLDKNNHLGFAHIIFPHLTSKKNKYYCIPIEHGAVFYPINDKGRIIIFAGANIFDSKTEILYNRTTSKVVVKNDITKELIDFEMRDLILKRSIIKSLSVLPEKQTKEFMSNPNLIFHAKRDGTRIKKSNEHFPFSQFVISKSGLNSKDSSFSKALFMMRIIILSQLLVLDMEKV